MILDRILTLLYEYIYFYTNFCTNTVERCLKANMYIVQEEVKQNEAQSLNKLSSVKNVLKKTCFVKKYFFPVETIRVNHQSQLLELNAL